MKQQVCDKVAVRNRSETDKRSVIFGSGLQVYNLTDAPASLRFPLRLRCRVGRHRPPRWVDNSGMWTRSDQNLLRYGFLLGDIGFALWAGGETRIGTAAWQSVDSVALAGLAAEVDKPAFGRFRPSATSDPNQWFQGGRSFPSGEVAEISGIVTSSPAAWF